MSVLLLPGARAKPSGPKTLLAALGVFYSAAVSLPAEACPRCAAGQEARRQVWADGFFHNLAAAVLPFIVVGAVSARLHGIGRVHRRLLDTGPRCRSAERRRRTSDNAVEDT